MLASAETENTLHGLLKSQDSHAVSTLFMKFYFMRLHLFSVNSITIDTRTRVTFTWSFLIWMTSMHNVSIVTKQNMASDTIEMCFLMMRIDTFHPLHNTSETSDNNLFCS